MKPNPTSRRRFWETKSLEQLSEAEWESLCDGCARCCLYKIEDADTGELFWTVVACRLLDLETCRCQSYEDRLEQVEACVQIRHLKPADMHLLPPSCAYRLIFEEKPLPEWHHLISGSEKTVHTAGASPRDKVIPEQNIPPETIEDYVTGPPIKPIKTEDKSHDTKN